jgi:hypothetical protein
LSTKEAGHGVGSLTEGTTGRFITELAPICLVVEGVEEPDAVRFRGAVILLFVKLVIVGSNIR